MWTLLYSVSHYCIPTRKNFLFRDFTYKLFDIYKNLKRPHFLLIIIFFNSKSFFSFGHVQKLHLPFDHYEYSSYNWIKKCSRIFRPCESPDLSTTDFNSLIWEINWIKNVFLSDTIDTARRPMRHTFCLAFSLN